jgi:hypothetical protein
MSDGDGQSRLTLADGSRVPVQAVFPLLGIEPEEGSDVLNFGSEGVTNNDVVSFTVGARMALMKEMSLGVGWEHPVTKRKDLLQNRLYVNLIWEL